MPKLVARSVVASIALALVVTNNDTCHAGFDDWERHVNNQSIPYLDENNGTFSNLFLRGKPTYPPNPSQNNVSESPISSFAPSVIPSPNKYALQSLEKTKDDTSSTELFKGNRKGRYSQDLIKYSNCASDSIGNIGVMKGLQMEFNFTYEVEVDKIPRAELFFVTEMLPSLERSFVDYLGQLLFQDDCEDSRLHSVVGIQSLPQDILSLDLECEEQDKFRQSDAVDEATKCFVMEGSMILIYISSHGIENDLSRIRGTLLGVIDRSFQNELGGVKRVSILTATYDENGLSSSIDETNNKTSIVASHPPDLMTKDENHRSAFIGVTFVSIGCVVLLAALVNTWRQHRREKLEWDEIRATFFD